MADDWSIVPNTVCQTPAIWWQLMDQAHTAHKRMAFIGDSQEAVYTTTGQGTVFLSRLNYEAWAHYGQHSGETMMLRSGSFGGGTPYPPWLNRGEATGGATAIPDRGAAYWMLGFTGLNSKFETSDDGALWMLQSTASSAHAGFLLADVYNFWDITEDTVAEIFAMTLSGGNAGLTVYVRPTAAAVPDYAATLTATLDQTALGLNAATGTIIKYTTPTLNWNSLANMQVVAKPNIGQAGDAIIVGSRFRSADHRGLTFSTFSEGGYKVTDVLAVAPNSGPMLSAMGPWDAVWVAFGTNDAIANRTAVQVKADLEALITALRGASWLNDSTLKIILTTDGYGDAMTAGQKTEFDQYPGVAAEIATADPYVLALNERRIMDAEGQNSVDWATIMQGDSYHHLDFGARKRAEKLWAALVSVGVPTFAGTPVFVTTRAGDQVVTRASDNVVLTLEVDVADLWWAWDQFTYPTVRTVRSY